MNFIKGWPENNTVSGRLSGYIKWLESQKESKDIYENKLYAVELKELFYFAKVIEWEFPNFSVDNYFDELCKLNEELNIKGYIESIEHRFILVCRK